MIDAKDIERNIQPEPIRNNQNVSSNLNKDHIAEALNLAMPAWPLQNTVAVNPFWNERSKHITRVFEELAPILHTKLYMPLDYYLEKYQKGAIDPNALTLALE